MQTYRIGRSEEQDIVIDEPTVSRKHFELVITNSNKYYITDCMSSQGTRVTRNGEWSEIIQDFVFGGDTILIGRYQIKMYDLLLLIEQTDSKPKKSRNDGRPKGKIERNPDTGEPILRAE